MVSTWPITAWRHGSILIHVPREATEEGLQASVKLSLIHSFHSDCAHLCTEQCAALRILWPREGEGQREAEGGWSPSAMLAFELVMANGQLEVPGQGA